MLFVKLAPLINSIVSVSKAAVRTFLAKLVSLRAALLFGEPFFWLLGQRRMKQKMVLSRLSRVLVVRLDGIGDVVLTTPFLRELRRTLPKAWITLVVAPQVYNLVACCPYVNEVLTYNWNIGGRYLQTFAPLASAEAGLETPVVAAFRCSASASLG